jgi:hypothetical protein
MFFLLRSPTFCVALASQVIQHARQDHFGFSGLDATFHRGFDPDLLYDLGRVRDTGGATVPQGMALNALGV